MSGDNRCGKDGCYFEGNSCHFSCSNPAHYEEKESGMCGLKDCPSRIRNTSNMYPCGSIECYSDVNDYGICKEICSKPEYYVGKDGVCIPRTCFSRDVSGLEGSSFRCGYDCVYYLNKKDNEKFCWEECSKGYVNVSGICVNVDVNCESVTFDETDSQSCGNNCYEYSGSCVSVCPEFYHISPSNPSSRICEPVDCSSIIPKNEICEDGCVYDNGNDLCGFSCSNTNHYNLVGKSCLEKSCSTRATNSSLSFPCGKECYLDNSLSSPICQIYCENSDYVENNNNGICERKNQGSYSNNNNRSSTHFLLFVIFLIISILLLILLIMFIVRMKVKNSNRSSQNRSDEDIIESINKNNNIEMSDLIDDYGIVDILEENTDKNNNDNNSNNNTNNNNCNSINNNNNNGETENVICDLSSGSSLPECDGNSNLDNNENYNIKVDNNKGIMKVNSNSSSIPLLPNHIKNSKLDGENFNFENINKDGIKKKKIKRRRRGGGKKKGRKEGKKNRGKQ
jgi:hypothetical protein